jgi:predicted RNA-binding Zn-ribbon protein involved in translation (DUF1610 family)
MNTANKTIVCSSCGARFGLRQQPAKRDVKFKCPKCGAINTAADEPARRGPAGAAARRPGASPRGGRSTGADASESKSGKGVLWGAIAGGVVLIALVVWLMAGGDDTPAEAATAKSPAAAEAPPAEQPAAKPEEPKPETVAEVPPEPPPAPADPVAADPAAAAAAAGQPEQGGAKPGGRPSYAPPNKRRLITSADQIWDPSQLPPLPAPADTTEEEQAKMDQLLQTMRTDTGGPGKRAGNQLAELGHKALFKIVNQLSALDYAKASDSMFAYQLNLLLEEMLGGANAGFKPPVLEEGTDAVDLQAADFNAQTVYVWHSEMHRWDTKEEFDAWVEQKRARAAATDEEK